MIRVGIGGWVFEPWRGGFYPAGLPQKRELSHASSKLTSIEINGTYYGSQKPESFRKWADETPDGFVFALKGSRFTTNRRVLAEAGESIERFVTSGITELGDKLGPINWQFMDTKKFDPADFEAFLALLPKSVDGRRLRHAVEVRHESFQVPEFVALARQYGVAIITADSAKFPQIADQTADFVYARLMDAGEEHENGYSEDALDLWHERAQAWRRGGVADNLPLLTEAPKAEVPRDVFVYMINGFKPKAPFAAMALIERIKAA
ncbi:DUF72 domain-containing protein [Kaistia dalseonensis]|uniref:Uncharacterized protein YecE (DUF72 family) n=1 Tax=Kaistia dalseonensis TaxID=410840 RepID=A0ABU0H5X9_9HYPH|nr:DUF72 domain-containing protein [Kaistia dalseonensis]MCX5495140.1 DUF72 domain-containing protein [Kaistia dalseonensis]MDQ0437722.1 uncharacterized protein YecE (DUF72 family) [Kaistia dalseonensis]